MRTTGKPQGPPIVNGDTMFVTSAEQVIALQATTGTLRWRYVHPLPADVRRPHSTNRGVALYDDMVYVGTLDAHVVALKATTGEVVWNRRIADYRSTYYITLAPLAVNGKIMVGTSGGEHGIRGFVTALDARTGNEIWKWYTIPAPGEPGSTTWTGESWRTGGGSVWVTGHYDPARNLTYWGVGNGGPWLGNARPGDNLYTNSTIALDADTGELRSHYQYHWNGSWDWDEANAPLLVDVERAGRTVNGLVHAGRNGYLWLLDRSGGDMRFLEAQPFVHQDVFASLDPVSGRPTYDAARVPRIGESVEFCPAVRGGRNWRPEAFSPQTGLLYVPATNNYCSTMEGYAVEYRAGRPFTGARVESFRRDGTDHIGELQAWDLDSGQRVWTQEFPTSAGSVLATAGELVFADSGGVFYAFDALSGELLWRYSAERRRPTGIPISYAVLGKQYVAVQFHARSEFLRHFVVQRPEVADAAPAHALARHRAQFVLRDVQPAPVFRRVAELDATNQFPCPGRLEHFVEGSLGVRVEVVAHQGDLLAFGVASFQQAGDLQRPVHLRTPGPGGRLPPTRQRLAEQEDRGRAGPFVLVVDTPGTVLRGRHRRAGFLDQLHRLLVHAHDGTIRIVGFLIQIQDLFHVRHELGIGLRRDHPVLDFPLGHPVFFSVRRMVSWLIDSMIANSTTRRASRRNDQFA